MDSELYQRRNGYPCFAIYTRRFVSSCCSMSIPNTRQDTFIADNDAYTHTLPPSQSPFRSPLTRLRSDINELEELDISYEQSHSNDDGEAQDGGDDFAKHPSTYVSSPDQNHIINAHATEVSSSSVDISGRTLVNKILDQPRSPSQPPAGFLDSKDHGVGDRPAIMLSHQDKTELSSISRIQHKPLLGRSTSDKENSQPHRNSPFVRLLIQDSPRARSPSPPVVFPRGLYHIHQYTARMRTNFQISQYLPSPSSRDICRQKRPAELLIQLQNKRPRWDTQVSGESLGGAETSARLLGCPKDEADHLTSCSRPFLPNVSVASTLASIARSGRSSFAHIVAGLNCIEVEETLPFSTGYVAHKRAFQRIDTKTKYRRSR
jgi:hypothetical protein